MKFLKLTCFSFFTLIFFNALSAQSLIKAFPFNDTTSVNNTGSEDDWRTGILNSEWEWIADGTGYLGVNDELWNNRSRILSESRGGAIRIVGRTEERARIISPPLNFSNNNSVFLRFNQYYRNFNSITSIIVQTGNTEVIVDTINTNVDRHIETGANDVQVIDISNFVQNNENIHIIFEFSGSNYFWIIDDVEFWEGVPPPPRTTPTSYGLYLDENDYPYAVDSLRWPYVPNQMVAQFAPNLSEAVKEHIRDSLGGVLMESCVCNTLELWRMTDSVYVDENGELIPIGGTIGLLANDKGTASSSTGLQGLDVNYYAVSEQISTPFIANGDLHPDSIVNLTIAPDNAIRIAVIDSGIDYNHRDLQGYMYLMDDELGDAMDNDDDCYIDNPMGYDFIKDTLNVSYKQNNPYDNHGHGTHVAGIIAQNLDDYASEECVFHIIPYKTHDQNGISTLFDVACATYLAIEDDVSVINDSWGFYGDSSIILSNAIDSALLAEILIVSAAGNDSLQLDTLLQYPACYTVDNRLTVGAVDSLNGESYQYSSFSNYSSNWVDILAPGRNVMSSIPDFSPGFNTHSLRSRKSGTSMATPAVTAAVAMAYCAQPNDYANAKDCILNCVTSKYSYLDTMAYEGRILDFDKECSCLTAVEREILLATSAFSIFPNPTNGAIKLIAKNELKNAQIKVFSIAGKIMYQHQFEKWYEGQQQSINLASLPAGVYFLQIYEGKTQWYSKIVKF